MFSDKHFTLSLIFYELSTDPSFLAPFALAENLAFLTIPQLTEKAEQGKAYSQYRLAYFYEVGKVASPNKEMALAYYQLACKNGEQKACETMGK
ncbi:hypothetical protein A1D25_08765 [Ursidibacter arcticus]|uniref:SEL1-like repeat protein n=1 Tax=Ursidibacter arcticus TaxID=1524965 RepID=UPI0019673AFC|nr:SEL1-like repeat protein [Ursidibacter arcticus]KAE9532855.1 hypothetical protein A1D25_08765 [Ursidibacter arcticus]